MCTALVIIMCCPTTRKCSSIMTWSSTLRPLPISMRNSSKIFNTKRSPISNFTTIDICFQLRLFSLLLSQNLYSQLLRVWWFVQVPCCIQKLMKVANSYTPEVENPPTRQKTLDSLLKAKSLNKDDEEGSRQNLNEESVCTLENGEVTEFYFEKLLHIEYQLGLVVALNTFLIVYSAEISFPELSESSNLMYYGCLYFGMLCFLIECVLVSFRMLTTLDLEKEQKIAYEKSTLFSSRKVFSLMVEWLVLTIQPYPFFSESYIAMSDSFGSDEFLLPVNDLLTAASLMRVYVLVRAGLTLTPYRNTRSNRLCKMYGCSADFSFSLKCMFKDSPLSLICLFFTVSALIFGFQIYMVERRPALTSETPESLCNNFTNSLWLVLMTITTVGYGDYFPHTLFGQIMVLIVAIWGTFIVSMMVVVVSNTLSMDKNEKRTTIVINKLRQREEIEQKAKQFLGNFMILRKYQKAVKANKSSGLNDQEAVRKLSHYQYLCRVLEKEFSRSRKAVKNGEDIEDIEDEVSSHFLHVNSDIEVLNRNQQKIIDFIHSNLEYHGFNDMSEPTKERGANFTDLSSEEARSEADSEKPFDGSENTQKSEAHGLDQNIPQTFRQS